MDRSNDAAAEESRRIGRSALAAAAVIVAVTAWLGSREIEQAFRIGNDVSPISDPFSEAAVLRAGEAYAVHGFFKNAGLPDIAYGDQVPEHGVKPIIEAKSYIYTHCPPLCECIGGLLTCMLGVGKVPYFRLFPIAISIASILFLGACLVRTLGPARGAGVFVALAAIPMFSNKMHGLYYQGYALALLLVQLGVLLLEARSEVIRTRSLVLLGVLGFVQGLMSFDYFFLISLCAIPCLVLCRRPELPGLRERLLKYCVAPAAGFCLAHLLHFAQVIVDHGGIAGALKDYTKVAALRLNGNLEAVQEPVLLVIFRSYFSALSSDLYFGFALSWLVSVTVAALLLRQAVLSRFGPPPRRLGWSELRRQSMAIVLAFVVCSLWISIMQNHALNHPHFLPRHFFLFYFVCVVAIARCTMPPRVLCVGRAADVATDQPRLRAAA